MDEQKEKALITEAEKLLQDLLDKNSLTIPSIQKLSKKLQKVNSENSKKILEDKKELATFVEDKIELKEYLEKDESNKKILLKAAQKILSKSQPKPEADTSGKKIENQTAQNDEFKFEKKSLPELFNKKTEEIKPENLYIYFENLSNEKLELNNVPLYTMVYYPKEKKMNFYLMCEDKIDLSFAQVDYLLNSGKDIMFNIDFYSMLENSEVERTREYKGNCLDLSKLKECLKAHEFMKGNDVTVLSMNNNAQNFMKEFKKYCLSIKPNIKSVITNNRDFFNAIINQN